MLMAAPTSRPPADLPSIASIAGLVHLRPGERDPRPGCALEVCRCARSQLGEVPLTESTASTPPFRPDSDFMGKPWALADSRVLLGTLWYSWYSLVLFGTLGTRGCGVLTGGRPARLRRP